MRNWIAIGLLGLLACCGCVKSRHSADMVAEYQIGRLARAVRDYHEQYDAYPVGEYWYVAIEMPSDVPAREGVPIDPWKQAYVYRNPASATATTPFEIVSIGQDRVRGTADDINNWHTYTPWRREYRRFGMIVESPWEAVAVVVGFAVLAAMGLWYMQQRLLSYREEDE